MANEVKISLPSLDHDGLVDWLQARLSQLRDAMDLVVSEYDPKAQIDRIVINSVRLDETRVQIEYALAFSADYTCSGIEYSGKANRILIGHWDGSVWVFPFHAAPVERSSADEL